MKLAHVDTSCLLAIALDEPGAAQVAARLSRFDRRFSSNLIEAELRSALKREGGADEPDALLSWITWIYPDRPLTREFRWITTAAYLKGADLWHLACALFLAPEGGELAFLTLDRQQKEAAQRVGFSF